LQPYSEVILTFILESGKTRDKLLSDGGKCVLEVELSS